MDGDLIVIERPLVIGMSFQIFVPSSGRTMRQSRQDALLALSHHLAQRMLELGKTPPVWISANIKGGDEYNANLWRAMGILSVKKGTQMSVLEKFKLSGKVGIVTGAAGGLGGAFSEALAEAGADLLIVTDKQTEKLREVAEMISKSTGRKVVPFKMDVTSEEDVENAVKKADEIFGRIDILVNNAGIALAKPAVKLELEEWNKIINLNLTGVFLCAREVARYMIEKGIKGSIINIASVYGELADLVPNSPYYSSKAAVINLTRGLAIEWGPFGIRVNSLCPGWFPTPGTKIFFESEEWVRHMNTKIPLRRLGKLDDLKPVIVFMASDASGYISGHTFEVLGGPLAVSATIGEGIKYLKDLLDEEYLKLFDLA